MEKTGALRLGIDLGGTNIKAGVVSPNNVILAQCHRPTLAGRPWEAVVEDMALAAEEALERAGAAVADCAALGVGSPGAVDSAAGTTVFSGNLHWQHVPLKAALERRLGLPVRVSNDANCAALGECVAAGLKNAVMITLGTGVGGGVVLDGKLLEGGPGGVEAGHTPLVSGGRRCTCGHRGCLEAYCSATALIKDAVRAARAHPESKLNELCGGDLRNMNGRIPFDAVHAGDPAARAVVDRYLRWLGDGIVGLVNLFRPEVVLLSGGLCGEGRGLTDPLNRYVAAHMFAAGFLPAPEVRIAELGNDAGILGAANLN